MFAYARNMKLAASDMGRRVALKAVAAVVAAVAVGFLIAALWTFLDENLDWGPLGASLGVAVLFLVIAGICWAASKSVKHPVPSTDELKREVETRVNLATDAALNKAHAKARQVIDDAGDKAVALMDDAKAKATGFVSDTEARVQGFANQVTGTVTRFTHDAPNAVARSVGLTPAFFDGAQQFTDRVKSSRAVPAASLLGAFAVGLTLAGKLQAARAESDDRDEYDIDDDDDWDDEDDWDDPEDDYAGA